MDESCRVMSAEMKTTFSIFDAAGVPAFDLPSEGELSAYITTGSIEEGQK